MLDSLFLAKPSNMIKPQCFNKKHYNFPHVGIWLGSQLHPNIKHTEYLSNSRALRVKNDILGWSIKASKITQTGAMLVNLNPCYQLPTSGPSDQLPLCQVGGGVHALHLKNTIPSVSSRKLTFWKLNNNTYPKWWFLKGFLFNKL